MSFFKRVTTMVQVDAKNRVEVRKLNYGERQRCMSKATRVKVQGKGKEQANEIEIDAGVLSMEMLKLAIMRWEGPDFESRPVTPSNVEELPTEVADLLAQAVDDLNPPLEEKEKKP